MIGLVLLALQAATQAAPPPATLGATNHGVDAPMAAPVGRPTAADEFDRIDPAIWRFDTSRNAAGWFNNEKQYYAAARPENVRIQHGALVIEARAETLDKARFPDWGGQGYTAAKLVSRRVYGYGFYEINAKLPCGRGIWPAIWMLPDSGTWPDMGEIDIMEMVGWDPNVVHATLHTGKFNHRLGTQRGAQKQVATSCTAFHRYQMDWQPHAITIGLDGRAYFRVADDQPGGASAWPFTKPFHMILNVAVGGNWGGQKGIDDRAFPQSMSVDYFRYWQR